MGGFGHSYQTLEEKVRFHKKRAQYHLDRAAEWERILSEIQRLQRLEQLPADAEVPKLATTKKANPAGSGNEHNRHNRFQFARDSLIQAGEKGRTPAEIRVLANEAHFSCPSNFPYKLLTKLVAQGKARKDKETGRYFAVKEKTTS